MVRAIPLFSMRLAFSDAGNDPTSLTTRQAYDLLAEGFGPGFNGPLVVAAGFSGPHAAATISALGRRGAGQLPGGQRCRYPEGPAGRTGAPVLVAG